MNAIELCAAHYARPILEKENPDFDGSDELAIATVFESTLPYTKRNLEDNTTENCALTHNNFFGYLIIQEDGYWARNRNGSGLKQKGAHTNLVPKWAGYYSDYERMQPMALYDFVKNWDKKPALIIEMNKTQFDFTKWQLTYDIRHLIINCPKQNYVLDCTFLLDLKQEEAA